MEMPLLKVKNYDCREQWEKVKEEFRELETVDVYSDHEAEDTLAEALDLITATCTLITHEYSKEQIQEGVKIHTEKLQSRGWETKGTIKIELEDEK